VKKTVTKVCWLLQAQNKTHCAKMFMMVLTDELVEKLVHERNRTRKYKPEASIHFVQERGIGHLSL
jgi:predicted site-specific integrase-resolvase